MASACGAHGPLTHPHPLERQQPAAGLLPWLCRRALACAGCGQALARGAVRYACGRKPRPCSYRLCESCFHLWPGGGGLVQTASFLSQDGRQRRVPLPSACRCCRGRGAATPLQGPAPPERARCSLLCSLSSPTIGAIAEEPELPAETGVSQDLANLSVAPALMPPRLAAADWDFGLQEDEAARARWESFAAGAGGAARGEGAEARLLGAAQLCAGHLRFLRLSVKGEEALLEEQQSCCKDHCLELYSPLARIPAGLKEELVGAARALPRAARALGALVGLAVGDSLGAPFEFLDAVDEAGASGSRFDLERFQAIRSRNRFRVKRGQWTDDSSMGLCLADSLLARGGYDGSDARVRFHNWWFRGYNNAFGNDDRMGSIGLGGNVAASLRALAPGEAPPPRYEAAAQDAGNGTLMRLAPLPIFLSRDPAAAARGSAESSYSTHPGAIAAAAAAFLGFAIARAIARGEEDATPARDFLDSVAEEFVALGSPGAEGCEELSRLLAAAEPEGGAEECWNWRAGKLRIQSSLLARGSEYNGYPCYPDYFGSYCIDGLAVALWSFYNTRSFMDAVVRCVNVLGDADTMAAICGQLAGAFYGYDAIDRRCIDALDVWDNKDIACRAALLFATRT